MKENSGCLKLFVSWQQRNQIIESRILEHAGNASELQILEAGCGQRWEVKLTGVKYHLTGIDLDKAALDIRKDRANDLDEIIQGDLRTVDLKGRQFDVIYNSYVLEHVDGAEIVMKNFVRWMKPGGMLVLKIPDPKSVKGFFTRVTPHWFHVLYCKYVLGIKTAGQPGHMPYPTYFDPVVSREGVHRFCRDHHLSIIDEYGEGLTKPGHGIMQRALQVFVRTVELLSIGSLSAKHSNLYYVIRRDSV